ncbi:hypothetical protein FB451DRAFT_1559001 [Mycena latifolia]|nr:hypothetical protein FB451DRAFT_1559001 [Mycena latifolia]
MRMVSGEAPPVHVLRCALDMWVGLADAARSLRRLRDRAPGNKLIVVVEAAPLEDFSAEAIRTNLQEALRVAAGNGSEEDKLEARIEADVYEALQHAISR